MVHALLERAVEVRERLRGAREAHVLAQVVAAARAEGAAPALDARLDRDALPDVQAGRVRARAQRGDDARGLVAQHERRLQSKVAVAAVCVVVHCAGVSGRACAGVGAEAWDVGAGWGGRRGLLTVAAAEARRLDLDLDVALLRGPERALLDAEVAGAVQDDGGLRAEHGRRHRVWYVQSVKRAGVRGCGGVGGAEVGWEGGWRGGGTQVIYPRRCPPRAGEAHSRAVSSRAPGARTRAKVNQTHRDTPPEPCGAHAARARLGPRRRPARFPTPHARPDLRRVARRARGPRLPHPATRACVRPGVRPQTCRSDQCTPDLLIARAGSADGGVLRCAFVLGMRTRRVY